MPGRQLVLRERVAGAVLQGVPSLRMHVLKRPRARAFASLDADVLVLHDERDPHVGPVARTPAAAER